jgi:hypothetical protein
MNILRIRMRIQEAQKHRDPSHPTDPDLEHRLKCAHFSLDFIKCLKDNIKPKMVAGRPSQKPCCMISTRTGIWNNF